MSDITLIIGHASEGRGVTAGRTTSAARPERWQQMAEWWSIEVFSGAKLPASGWRYAYEDELTEAALTHGALYYEWHDTEYGVIFELLFGHEAQWAAFAALPAVRAALDAVPDPVNGLLVYRGRGGAAGSRRPRKPKPAPGAAALELEEPREQWRIRLAGTEVPGTEVPGTEPVSRDIEAFDRFDS